MAAVGVDACKGGWVAVVLRDGAASGVFGKTLAAVAEQVPEARGFGVDIPLGLPVAGQREADVQAKRLLGPRRNSIFHTPPREALLAPTHAEATRVCARLTGKGLSRQSYGLGARILEAETWSANVDVPVWEVHPEVSFTVLLGAPPAAAKSTWAGARARWEALAGAGIDLRAIGGPAASAGVDDVLDAAVVAWSVGRLLRGAGFSVPDPPETSATGAPMAIWA